MEDITKLLLKNGYKPLKDTTLNHLTKSDLIDTIRILEYNWAITLETVEQQCLNFKNYEPVIHAHWEETGLINIQGTKDKRCTNCGDHYCALDWNSEKYCRNCGAKMDEENM